MPVHCFAGHPNLSRLCGLYAKGLTILTDVFSEGAAWMRGRIIPIGEACIPITDWGLTHCDITYDVVPVWNGGMFRLPAYLDRFEASMAALHLDPDMTRRTVLEIATQLGLQVDIRPLPQTVLLDADEVFISSSAGGIIPIVKVNETIFAGGACGPATQSIYQTYWDWMAAPAYRTEIIYNN